MTAPTLVLLQGAFQLPDVYHSFATLLKAHGYPTHQPAYPSLAQDDPDLTTKDLTHDAAAVESLLRTLIEEEGKTVVLVMHSYGGLVGSEAVPESLSLKHRSASGEKGGVAHLFYLAAFVLPLGQSAAQTTGPPPNHNVHAGKFCLRDPRARMYSDLPPEEAEYWTARVVRQSAAVLETPVERCAWRYVPSTYVVCTADQAVAVPIQEMFAGLAGASRREIEAGHSAFLSKPDEVLRLIAEVAPIEGFGG